VERAKGIEPSYEAWEAAVLPLNYARDGSGFYRQSPRSPDRGRQGWVGFRDDFRFNPIRLTVCCHQ
jgi:hypothetical protein